MWMNQPVSQQSTNFSKSTVFIKEKGQRQNKKQDPEHLNIVHLECHQFGKSMAFKNSFISQTLIFVYASA